jgi:thiamine biosynthesis lipoprotein
MKSIVVLLALFKLLWAVEFYGETRLLWGIPVTVLVYGEEGAVVEAVDRAFREMESLGRRLSYYSESSEVKKINASAGKEPVRVSKHTLEVLRIALRVSRITGGAYDVTVGPLLKLWDFKNGRVPDPEEIRKALRKVDYRKVRLDPLKGTVFLPEEGMEIHLGGIIKGYLADRAVEVLRDLGMKAGLVAVGGDVRVFGSKPGGRAWRIGVRDPRGEGILALLELTDVAVSTSGDYERFFLREGKRYHHLIDPRTGYPAGELASVTVLASSSAFADALATGLFILGPERALELLGRLGLEGILVTPEGKVYATEGVRRFLLTPEPPVEIETHPQ